MAAYLQFYQLEKSPFESDAAKKGLVLGTRSLKGALGRVKQGLDEGSPRICLSGSAGVGKTSFCRALPKLLADSAQSVVVLDPCRPWREIRATIAKKFKLDGGAISRRALMATREGSKRLVLVIDQAESLSHESLDHLDVLLQYKCDDGKQLLHCIMLANLEAASSGTETPLLWWLDKFTTMQLQFSPIPAEGIRHYVEKHLARAGWAGGELFTKKALAAIHHNTGGVPRAINELCEKILIEGGARAISSITDEFIEELCGDSKPEPEIDFDRPDPGLATEWSVGGAKGVPTAQDMLDAVSRDAGPLADAEIEANRDRLLDETHDMSSLLVTQDSPEVLRVDTPAKIRAEDASNLELEVEPGESQLSREESFYGQTSPIGAPIGMGRIAIASQSRKGRGGMFMMLLVLALIAYVINSQFSMPTELIESAEVKIAETIEKQTKRIAPPEVEAATEAPAEESSLPPSILDRADDIIANSAADSAAEAALDLGEAGEINSPVEDLAPEHELAVTPRLDPIDGSPADDTRSEVPVPPAAKTTTSTPAVAKTIGKPAPATTKPSSTFSNDLMVVNEYTAIPEAASSPPKLPLPVPAQAKPKAKAQPTPAPAIPARIQTNPGAPTAKERAKPKPTEPVPVPVEDEWTIDW